MLEINQIHHGDCLELMWDIPDHSVDMVLADLPYGTTACAWDSIIDLDLLWGHYKRIIKPGGAIVLTASQPFTTVLAYSNLKWFKYEWVWDKVRPSGMQVAKVKPMQRHESVLVFGVNGGRTCYNPIMEKRDNPIKGRIVSKSNSSPVKYNDGNVRSYSHSYPQSILKFTKPSSAMHPTQKPVSLFAYLINTYSNPGDLILDNTAGSGTTAIAAIQTGRNWLCIEKDETIYQTASNRIAKAMGQGFTPAARAGQPNNQNQAELLQRGLWE